MYLNRPRQSGFTIVELLIVIVVIGILAAITIVAYNGVQNRANDIAIQNDLAQLSKKLEMYKVDSSTGTYPTNTAAALTPIGIALSKSAYTTTTNNFIYCVKGTSLDQYGVVGVSKSGKAFMISSISPKVAEYPSPPISTGNTVCPDLGITSTPWWLWGYAWANG